MNGNYSDYFEDMPQVPLARKSLSLDIHTLPWSVANIRRGLQRIDRFEEKRGTQAEVGFSPHMWFLTALVCGSGPGPRPGSMQHADVPWVLCWRQRRPAHRLRIMESDPLGWREKIGPDGLQPHRRGLTGGPRGMHSGSGPNLLPQLSSPLG